MMPLTIGAVSLSIRRFIHLTYDGQLKNHWNNVYDFAHNMQQLKNITLIFHVFTSSKVFFIFIKVKC